MGFEGLLGNEQLKSNLRASVGRGRAAHFYLISGPKGSGKHTLAQLLAAALVCREADKPCLSCSACRKVLGNSHPDVITVVDPDHKTVAVKLVRQYREDIFIKPNEADRKIYIFPQEMGVEGQNALLKVLEEPPSYGVFMILSENPESLLPTIRSRCTQLRLNSLSESQLRSALLQHHPEADPQAIAAAVSRSGGYLGQAEELLENAALSPQSEGFAAGFGKRNSLGLAQTLVPMERWKRDQLIPELESWIRLLHEALLSRSGHLSVSPAAAQLAAGRSAQELMQAVQVLKKCVEYATGNVSVAAICGHLLWALR